MSEMKITNEQKVAVVLLITGTIILVASQNMINEYGQVEIIIPGGPNRYPWWRPPIYSSWPCPSFLIRFQEIGVAVLASGITLMIRARTKKKDQRRE